MLKCAAIMDDTDERREVEVIELDEPSGSNPYSVEKLAGVAVAGALGSLVLYYLFNQLDRDKRDRVKDNIVSLAKKQLAKLGEDDETDEF